MIYPKTKTPIEDLDGMFTGQFEPEEYMPYIEAGMLVKDWSGAGSLLGLSKLRRTYIELKD